MLQARGGARTSGEHVEGDRGAVDVAGHVGLGAHRRVEVGVGRAGDRDRMPADSTGSASTSGCAADSSSRSVRTRTKARLTPRIWANARS